MKKSPINSKKYAFLHWSGAFEWIVDKKLGAGAFGQVYLARRKTLKLGYNFKGHGNLKDDQQVALKICGEDNENGKTLYTDRETLLELKKLNLSGPGTGFPFIYDSWVQPGKFRYIVMQKLNPLKEYFNDSIKIDKRKYDKNRIQEEEIDFLKGIGRNLLTSLELFHKNGFIHGDIKPDNLMIDEDFNPYFIDFGNSYNPKSVKNLNEIFEGRNGTIDYAGSWVHKGYLPLYFDDLESLAYSLIDIAIGDDDSKWIIIGNEKNSVTENEILDGHMEYKFLYSFLNYIRNNSTQSLPNYDALYSFFSLPTYTPPKLKEEEEFTSLPIYKTPELKEVIPIPSSLFELSNPLFPKIQMIVESSNMTNDLSSFPGMDRKLIEVLKSAKINDGNELYGTWLLAGSDENQFFEEIKNDTPEEYRNLLEKEIFSKIHNIFSIYARLNFK